MQDYFTDKGKTDILRSTRTGPLEIILCQGRETCHARGQCHAGTWGWTLRRHRRSATRYGITESRMNTKELCRRPCPRRLPVPGQRCRKSSTQMEPSPVGGLIRAGAAALRIRNGRMESACGDTTRTSRIPSCSRRNSDAVIQTLSGRYRGILLCDFKGRLL